MYGELLNSFKLIFDEQEYILTEFKVSKYQLN